MKIKIIYYRCYDHFTEAIKNSMKSYENQNNECIQEGVGIFVSEDIRYIKLKMIDADINMPNSEKEYNYIIKSALLYKKEIEIEVNS